MQGVRIWLPNIEGFFTSLDRLLEGADGQRNTASYNSAEFFSHRLLEISTAQINTKSLLIS